MKPERIPLFPLDVVLFPGRSLPLHIFEPRYREMTRHCLETKSPFGIVLSQSKAMSQTGCTALIAKVLKEYEDGRSDILTIGQKIFRLYRTYSGKSYMEADVVFLEEDNEQAKAEVSARLEELFDQCHRVLYNQSAPPIQAEENVSLAFHVGAELPLELSFRQSLLELRSEADRQQRLVDHLTELYPQLQRRERVRGKATGNGHGNL
jgi:ATP-dependent Lon protease